MAELEHKLLTPDQLCDALEVHLGAEKGKRKCRELLDKLKADPDWRAQINSLGCTVQVFQKVEKKDVPEDVTYRLMTTLNLGEGRKECNDDANAET